MHAQAQMSTRHNAKVDKTEHARFLHKQLNSRYVSFTELHHDYCSEKFNYVQASSWRH